MFIDGLMRGVETGGWVVGFLAVTGGFLILVGAVISAILYVTADPELDGEEAKPRDGADHNAAGAKIARVGNTNPARIGGHDC